MKRLLLAIALLLGLADVAAAQNVTCATRPVTDNSNACANTAFVNSYVNNPASPIYSTAHTWLATQTFSPVSGTAVALNGTLTMYGDVVLTHPLTPTPDNTASSNITLGVGAGAALAPIHSTQYLTLLGFQAGAALTTEDHITAVGAWSLSSYNAGGTNTGITAIGIDAMRNLTSGQQNVAVGEHTLTGATSASYTTAVGYNTMLNFGAGGTYNSAFGYFALGGSSGTPATGLGNTALGSYALVGIAGTGTYNTAVGMQALYAVAQANGNVGIGYQAGLTVTTGYANTIIGTFAGSATLATGHDNILIGTTNNVADTPLSSTSNYLNIGNFIYGTTAGLTISPITTGSATLTGSSSGSTKLQAAAAASGTLTLPAATDTLVGKATTDTLTNKSISGSSNTLTDIPNSALVNASTTVNGQTCTLGSSCTVTASATTVTVGSTAVASGTNGYVLYNNSGTLGNLSTTGSGVVALATSPSFTTDIRPASSLGATLGASGLNWGQAYLSDLSLSNSAARNITVAASGASTVGRAFTVAAGGSGAGTNLTGGNLILSGGGSTGNGGGGSVLFYAADVSTGSGTTANTPAEMVRVFNTGGYGGICFRGASCSSNNYAFLGGSGYSGSIFNAETLLLFRLFNGNKMMLDAAKFEVGSTDLGGTIHLGTAAYAAPGISACGSSPSIVGTDTAGEVTMGTGSPTTCVITFNVAYTSAPFCVVTWQGNPLATQNYTVSNVSITIGQTATSSNKLNYHCIARSGG